MTIEETKMSPAGSNAPAKKPKSIKILLDCQYNLLDPLAHARIFKAGEILSIDPDLEVPFKDKKVSVEFAEQLIKNKQGVKHG